MTKESSSRLKTPAISDTKINILISVLMFAITFGIHWATGSEMKMLHMSHDEMGVLSAAAFAVGEDWSSIVSEIGYYGYGSSVIYIPIFLITQGPLLRYKLIIAVNSFIMSLVPLIAYYILIKYLGTEKITAATISLAVGLYPGYLLYSKWVWNETMMCFLPWLMLLAVIALYNSQKKSKRILFSILIAFILVYSYAVHGRGIALIASVIAVIAVVFIFQRRLIIEPISFVITFIVAFIADNRYKEYIMNRLWLVGESKEINNTVGGTIGKLDAYLTADGFWGMLRIAGGQFFAAIASTYGILVIALVFGLPIAFGGLKKNMRLKMCEKVDCNHNIWLISTLSLVFFAAAFLMSVLFLGNHGSADETRGDYYIYTRYFSNVLGIVIFIALYLIYKKTTSRKAVCVSVVLYVLSLIPILLMAEEINEQPSIANTTLLNLLAYIGENPKTYIREIDFNNLILIVSIVFVLVLFAVNSKKHNLLHLALCGVFVQSYFTTANNVILENSDTDYSYVHTTMHILYQVPELAENYPDIYYYNIHQAKPWSSSALQFVLPEYNVTEFDFAIGNQTDSEWILNYITENSIIVSSEEIMLEQFDDEIYRLDHELLNKNKEYIWVYGDEVRNYITENSSLEFVK